MPQPRDRLEHPRATAVMAAVAADKQHIDRSLSLGRVSVHFRIVCGREVFGAPTALSVAPEDTREVANYNRVGAKVRARGWCCSPGDALAHATRQFVSKLAVIAHRIEVVEDFGTMMLDLGQQNRIKRCAAL